jgi:hypothetical protein
MAKKPKPKNNPEVRVERTERELPVTLTEKELKERGHEAAELAFEISERENGPIKKLKDDLAELKKLQAEAEDRRDMLLLDVRSGTTKRLVKCDEVMNYETKRVEYYYPKFEDGARPVDSRDFTPEEHQIRMFKNKSESIASDGDELEGA